MTKQDSANNGSERYESSDHVIFFTEDAVAENIPVGISSAVTSDAYDGIRAISKKDNYVTDFEVFGRLGSTAVDIAVLDGSCREWEDAEISSRLGHDDKEILVAVAKCVEDM
jgi:hypothetical protein